MSDYKFEKLDSTQFDLLIPMMEDCFGMEASVDYFKWKFMENPAGSFVGFVAVEEKTGEVSAYYGVIPEDYVIKGEPRKIYQSCDTMTHSRHRRKGLFQKLAVKCYDYLRDNNELFIIGFGGGQSTPGFLKFGWKHAFDFHNLFIPKILCYPSMLAKVDEKDLENVSDISTLQHLFEKSEKSPIQSRRQVENVVWRYKNPLTPYQTRAFKKDGKIEGYVSCYPKDNKLFIFDFSFSTSQSRRTLINYLKKEVLKAGLQGIVAFCQENGDASRELKKGGFLTNPFGRGPMSRKTPFIFYADEKEMIEFNNSASWSITSYDHDAF